VHPDRRHLVSGGGAAQQHPQIQQQQQQVNIKTQEGQKQQLAVRDKFVEAGRKALLLSETQRAFH